MSADGHLFKTYQVGKMQMTNRVVLAPMTRARAESGDVLALKTTPGFPSHWLVSGVLYDVASALIEVVEKPTLISDHGSVPVRS